MSIKNDGDLLLTKARSVINMCMFVIFSVYVSFYCTFSSSVSPCHYRQMIYSVFHIFERGAISVKLFHFRLLKLQQLHWATCVFKVYWTTENYAIPCANKKSTLCIEQQIYCHCKSIVLRLAFCMVIHLCKVKRFLLLFS